MSSVSAASARIVVEHCRAQGADTDALLRACALSPASIEDPNARLSDRAIGALWMTAFQTLGDPALGLHVAESARRGSHPITCFLAAHSPTVGAAFERICAYGRWVDDARQLRVVEHGDRIAVEIAPVAGSSCAQRTAAEHALALCLLGVARATASDITPLAVDVAAPPPDDRTERERVFRAPVRFGQSASRLWLSRDTWQRSVPGADSALLALLEAHAQRLVEQLPAPPSLLREARVIVERGLGDGPPTVRQVARELGMSVRSLQRSLASHGATFSELIEQARIASARDLLADRSRSIAEIALLLGFSEQSAFTRACKRWLGQPPNKLRGLALGSPPEA